MVSVFGENPIVDLRRPRGLRDELVRFESNNEGDQVEDMKTCGESRCKICTFV